MSLEEDRRPREREGLQPPGPPSSKQSVSPAGLILGAAGLFFCGWSAHRLLVLLGLLAGADSGLPAENEDLAVQRLQAIHQAQQTFRLQDRDGDGLATYAAFYTHLWQTPGSDGRVERLGLIERQLAFAWAPGRALDGYWYLDVHAREQPEELRQSEGPIRPFDPAAEWAVVALPAAPPRSGRRTFLVLDTGEIWSVEDEGTPLDALPLDLTAEGWSRVADPRIRLPGS